jgi:hypothetical protein
LRDPGRPVLDRIPGWKRTRLAVTSGGSADSVGVRLSGVVLLALGKPEAWLSRPLAEARLNRRRPLAEPRHANTRGSARRRHLTDICGAGGGQDTQGRASTQRRSRNSGARLCHRNEALVAIHRAHPLPSRRRKVTEEHRKKPKDPGPGGQLLFLAYFCGPGGRARFDSPGTGPPQDTTAPGHGHPRTRPPRTRPPRDEAKAQVAVRTRPSCTTDTTRSPASVKTCPRASPRPPAAIGDS